jgi:hypothetical protein
MNEEKPRTDANGLRHSPDQQYSLSIEQAAELYAKAGLPRTIRAVQKYCTVSKLDCHKVETQTGEKYLVAPYSVTRHIAYINEVRTVASIRDQTRISATVLHLKNEVGVLPEPSANGTEQTRPGAAIRDEGDRYVAHLEDENIFLRGQMGVKDTQIKELTERARETNILIGGLQKLLSPLLSAPGDRRADKPGNELNT